MKNMRLSTGMYNSGGVDFSLEIRPSNFDASNRYGIPLGW